MLEGIYDSVLVVVCGVAQFALCENYSFCNMVTNDRRSRVCRHHTGKNIFVCVQSVYISLEGLAIFSLSYFSREFGYYFRVNQTIAEEQLHVQISSTICRSIGLTSIDCLTRMRNLLLSRISKKLFFAKILEILKKKRPVRNILTS